MYPFIRLGFAILRHRRASALRLGDTLVSEHICWPWDLDPWGELNNGRTLTLYDLGRVPMGLRMGLSTVARRHGWGLAVAGVSVRYRRRIRSFQRVRMFTRVLGWDARFFYVEQSLWRGETCLNHMLLRSAVTSPDGIVAPAAVAEAMGHSAASPALPDWAQAWIDAEAARPWPPA